MLRRVAAAASPKTARMSCDPNLVNFAAHESPTLAARTLAIGLAAYDVWEHFQRARKAPERRKYRPLPSRAIHAMEEVDLHDALAERMRFPRASRVNHVRAMHQCVIEASYGH